jgi:Na+/proline symporter
VTAVGLAPADLGKLGVGITAVLVVIGIVLALVLTKLIARAVIAVVVIAVVVIVWQQRGAIEHKIDQHVCPPRLSFFGMHVDAPQSVHDFCRTHRSG